MKCWHCNTNLIWGSDRKITEMDIIPVPNENFSIVTNLSCPGCGSYVEVFLPKELEL